MRVNGPLKGSISGELHHAAGCRYGFGEDTVALLCTGKTALPDAVSRGDKTAQHGNILQSCVQADRPCIVVHVETRRKGKRLDEDETCSRHMDACARVLTCTPSNHCAINVTVLPLANSGWALQSASPHSITLLSQMLVSCQTCIGEGGTYLQE